MSAGKHILALRQKQNKSRRELAELSGVSESAIKQYETGKRQPRVEQLQRLADALGVDLRVLVGAATADADGVIFSSGYVPNLDDNNSGLENLIVYDESWEKRVMETLKSLPEDRKQNVLEYLAFQRDKSKGANSDE